jgi:hypothetical protein
MEQIQLFDDQAEPDYFRTSTKDSHDFHRNNS